MLAHKQPNLKLKGFTVVEMVIVIPIVILVIGVFVYAIINMTGDVLASRASDALAYNIQDALNRIEADIKISDGYLTTSITPNTPQGVGDGASPFQKSNNLLILNSFATTDNPLSSTRNIVYTSSPNACNTNQVSQNPPLMFNVVYFTKDNNTSLWRRVIAPSNYADINARCGTPWQQPSCTPGYTNLFCKTQDVKLVTGKNITFGIVYPTPPSISIGITITTTDTVAGRDITQSGAINAVSLNN